MRRLQIPRLDPVLGGERLTRSFPEVATSLHEIAQRLKQVRHYVETHPLGKARPYTFGVLERVTTPLDQIQRDLLGLADGLSELQRVEKPLASGKEPPL